jgi:Protein of unknown function (DUF664)
VAELSFEMNAELAVHSRSSASCGAYDLAMIAPDIERQRVPRIADKRVMLDAWLEFHRATLLMKCSGLDESQLKRCAVEPSTLSLLFSCAT